MTNTTHRWGATPEEWDWAAFHFGDAILPAVGDPDPNLQRSRGLQHLDSLAKTPSIIGSNGQAHGIKGWTVHSATPAQVQAWRRDPAHNILVSTRNIRAIDIDVDDKTAGDKLEDFIQRTLGAQLPVRYRANSGKRTLLLRLDPNPNINRRRIAIGGYGMIEFLADKQQTAVFGTHPSGARFEMRGHEHGIPVVPIESVIALWDMLGAAYDEAAGPLIRGDESAATYTARNGGARSDDPVVKFLEDNGWVTGYEANGLVNIMCPNAGQHTTQSLGSSTSYMPAGVGGKEHGGFKCLHAHCEHINTPAFMRLIGYETEQAAQQFTSTAVALPVTTALVTSPSGEAQLVSAITAPRHEALGFRRSNKGEVLKTFANLMEILRADGDAVAVRMDAFTQVLGISLGGGAFKPIDDDDISILREIVERRYGLAFSADEVRQAVSSAARNAPYDSAIEWLSGLKWDGVDRIGRFARDVWRSADTEYHRAAARYMWVSAAGRILFPGVKADMSVVLISHRQGTGKSSSIRAMSPFENWWGEMGLDSSDADLARLMRGKSVIEIPELKGLSAREAADVKAFLSRTEEELIPKYREFSVTLKRRCVFVGTENRSRFLSDPTGNRRFLPVHVAVAAAFVDWPTMQAELAQYWAQARDMLAQHRGVAEGVDYFATAARNLAGPYVAAATQLDAWHGAISEFVARQDYDVPISIGAIAFALLPGGASALDHSRARRIRDTMIVLGVEETASDVWVKRNTRMF